MSVINTGKSFSNGEQLTADKLNQSLSEATFGTDAFDGTSIQLTDVGSKLGVRDLGVTTAKLADDAVTTAKIEDGGITPTKLSTGAPSWDTSSQLFLTGASAKVVINDGSEAMGFIGNKSGSLFINAGGTSDTLLLETNGTERMRIDSDGSVTIGKAVLLENTSEPSIPTGGGTLYVEGGALKFKGSSGTVTTIASA